MKTNILSVALFLAIAFVALGRTVIWLVTQ